MKKVMFALCSMLGGILVVSAQETQDPTSNQYRTETQSQYPQGQNLDQDRERIQSTELPDGVKRSLEGQEYRGWLINGAYKATVADQSLTESEPTSTKTDINQLGGDNKAAGAQGKEIFIVELKNGAQTKTLRFDSEGKKLASMGEDQNDQNNQYNQNDQVDQQDQTSPNNQPDQSSPDDPNDK